LPDAHVLVVDDSPEMVATLSRYLTDHGWKVSAAVGGEEALDAFGREPVDVVLTDLRMRGMDGIDVLEGVRRLDAGLPVVLMTAFGSVESAVEAIQRGAYHYVTKPFNLSTVRQFLERAVRDRRSRLRAASSAPASATSAGGARLLGLSPAMRALGELVEKVARAPGAVLIVGETGTGKEVVARAIHEASARARGPFVSVACAALPEAVLETELFGHAAGAFPGAAQARGGLFAKADGGTLFLDEVADLPFPLQGKLLRALEAGEVRPLGDDLARQVDVRCIASTHADLAALVQAGRFRKDLYFRLNVIPVQTVPLRDRSEDVPLLLENAFHKVQERLHEGRPRRLSPSAAELLARHDWPGNVRELENLVQRLVVTTAEEEIDAEAVSAALVPMNRPDPADTLAAAHLSLKDVEDRYVDAVLRRSQGNKASAAAILGIDVSTIYRRKANKRR